MRNTEICIIPLPQPAKYVRDILTALVDTFGDKIETETRSYGSYSNSLIVSHPEVVEAASPIIAKTIDDCIQSIPN